MILGAFAKLRKATISFIITVVIFKDFEKSVAKIQVSLKSKNNGTLHEDRCTLMVSR
jgi:hypothetical protein